MFYGKQLTDNNNKNEMNVDWRWRKVNDESDFVEQYCQFYSFS